MCDVTSTSSYAGGLVGYINSNSGSGATISIENSYVTGNVTATDTYNSYAGGLVGYATGNLIITIDNTYVMCDITASSSSYSAYAGGFIGYTTNNFSTTTIITKNSYTTGNVTTSATSSAYAGGFVGYISNSNSGTKTITIDIDNSHSNCNLSSTSYAGGFVGYISFGGDTTVTIQNSYVMGNISSSCAGGLVGYIYRSNIIIKNSYTVCDVTSTSSYAGGLVGYGTTITIDNCYTAGDVSAYSSSSAYAGGLVGLGTTITIDNCYAVGSISSYSTSSSYPAYVGGLIGSGSGTIKNSHATSDVTVSSSYYAYAGGLAGYISSTTTIENSYATGNVFATSSSSAYVGGLVGYINSATTLSNTSAKGNVTATGRTTYAGALVGYINNINNLTISDSYRYETQIILRFDEKDIFVGEATNEIGELWVDKSVNKSGGLEIQAKVEIEVGEVYNLFSYLQGKDIDWTASGDESRRCTWTSSDTSVVEFLTGYDTDTSTMQGIFGNYASLDGKGSCCVPILGVGVGTATITVRLNSDISVSCVVVVIEKTDTGGEDGEDENNNHRVIFITDTWRFPNQTSKISLNYFNSLWKPLTALTFSLINDGTGGQCYGMVATTGAINDKKPNIISFKHKYNNDFVNKVRSVVEEDMDNYISNDIGMSVGDFIKYGYILQLCSDISKQRDNNSSKKLGVNKALLYIYNAVKEFENDKGEPVEISIYGKYNNKNAGHSLYALRVENDTDFSCDIIVNDSNRPSREQKITLFKENDTFTGWEYLFYESPYTQTANIWWRDNLPNANISYTTPSILLYYVAKEISMANNTNIFKDEDNLLLVTNTAFENDILLPIYPSNDINSEEQENLYWLGKDNNPILFFSENPMKISLVDGYSGIKINIGANSNIELNVGDNIKNSAVIDTLINSEFSISHLFAGDNDNINNITVKGISKGTVEMIETENGISFVGEADNIIIEAEIDGNIISKSYDEILKDNTINVEIVNNDGMKDINIIVNENPVVVSNIVNVIVTPNILDNTGGDVEILIIGENLTGQDIKIYLDGKEIEVAEIIDNTTATAIILIPGNIMQDEKTHIISICLNGEDINKSVNIVVDKLAEVPVIIPATFTVSVKSIAAKVGKSQTIPVNYAGTGTSVSNLKFVSSNVAICEVVNGIITPKKAGVAVITISAPGFAPVVVTVTVTN